MYFVKGLSTKTLFHTIRVRGETKEQGMEGAKAKSIYKQKQKGCLFILQSEPMGGLWFAEIERACLRSSKSLPRAGGA